MGYQPYALAIRRGRPEDVIKAIEGAPIMKQAARQGLVEQRVLFDPASPRRAMIEMWWKSAAQAQRFAEKNPRLSIVDDTVSVQSTGTPQLFVSQTKLPKTRG